MYNNLKKRSRQLYYLNFLNNYKQDVKGTWQILRPLTGKQKDRSNVTSDFTINGIKVNDPQNKADWFCIFFSQI